jgi:hypothetical protein
MISRCFTRRQTLWTVVLALASGCTGMEGDEQAEGPDFANLVPVSGVITLNGEPLQGAVITFLPKAWSPGLGETNAKGEFTVSSSNRPGIAPGDYKVAISLLLSPEGVPQGVGPRSSLTPPQSLVAAKEILPREYTDLGSSKLTATVKPKGGHFEFDVKAPGLVIPAPPTSPAQEKEAETDAEGDPPAKPASPGTPPAPAANDAEAP